MLSIIWQNVRKLKKNELSIHCKWDTVQWEGFFKKSEDPLNKKQKCVPGLNKNVLMPQTFFRCFSLTCSGCVLGVRVIGTSSFGRGSTGLSGFGSDLGLRLKKLRKLKGPVCCLGLFMFRTRSGSGSSSSWGWQTYNHEQDAGCESGSESLFNLRVGGWAVRALTDQSLGAGQLLCYLSEEEWERWRARRWRGGNPCLRGTSLIWCCFRRLIMWFMFPPLLPPELKFTWLKLALNCPPPRAEVFFGASTVLFPAERKSKSSMKTNLKWEHHLHNTSHFSITELI